mmetsp:Transcript_18573/g.37953  ORF Transcript_18573/g.37953 Transcript_18573/m.37953 type:complete len:250 (+) Transcript_18573:3159-3908(+)
MDDSGVSGSHIGAERGLVGLRLLRLARGRLGNRGRLAHVGGVEGVLFLVVVSNHLVEVDGSGGGIRLLRELLNPAVKLEPSLLVLGHVGVGGRGTVPRLVEALVDGLLDVPAGVATADDLLVVLLNVVPKSLHRRLDAGLDGPSLDEVIVNELEADLAEALLELQPSQLRAPARISPLERDHDGLAKTVQVLGSQAQLLRDDGGSRGRWRLRELEEVLKGDDVGAGGVNVREDCGDLIGWYANLHLDEV